MAWDMKAYVKGTGWGMTCEMKADVKRVESDEAIDGLCFPSEAMRIIEKLPHITPTYPNTICHIPPLSTTIHHACARGAALSDESRR